VCEGRRVLISRHLSEVFEVIYEYKNKLKEDLKFSNRINVVKFSRAMRRVHVELKK
jgi:hypothetical protein